MYVFLYLYRIPITCRLILLCRYKFCKGEHFVFEKVGTCLLTSSTNRVSRRQNSKYLYFSGFEIGIFPKVH